MTPKKAFVISLLSTVLLVTGVTHYRETRDNPNITLYEKPSIPRPTAEPTSTPELRTQHTGMASYYTTDYCEKYNPSCKTANGDTFSNDLFTCACTRDIKLGTRLNVTYDTKTITVTCNDRGSFSESYGRVLDLSPAAFKALAPLSKGVIKVSYAIAEE